MCGKGRGGHAPRALWDNKRACLAKQDGNDSLTHPSVLLSGELTSTQAVHVWGRTVHSSFSSSLGFWDDTAGLAVFSLQLLSVAASVWKPMTLSVPRVLTGPLAPACVCVSPHSMNLLHKPCLKPQCSFTWRRDYFLNRTFLCRKYLFPFFSSAESFCYSKDPFWRLARHTRDASEGDPSWSSRFWIMLQPITCVGFASSLK